MVSGNTRHFKLNAPEELCDRMNAELEDAPTYVIKIVPSSTEITLTDSHKPPKGPTPTTDTALNTPSLHTKLSTHLPPKGPASPLRYETVGELGEGGAGKVYEMLDENLKRHIAVKRLKSQSGASDIDQFLSEGILAAEMEHPNIIPIYDLDVDQNGHVFMTMKKVEGASLGSLIESKEVVDLERVLLICLKICDALGFAHSRGKTHQDVKPENIMLGDYGEVFLIDWGASSASGDEMQLSPVYMSPQQAAGKLPTTQDDIYCLGASLFHVLTKRFPTNAKTIDELWEKKLSGTVDPFTLGEQKQIPPQVRAIIMKALAVNPEHRYQTIEEFAQDLMNYQVDLPISAYSDSLSETFNRFYRRHHTICNIIATSIIILTMATGYYLLDLNREKAEKFKAIADAERMEAEKLRAVEKARQKEEEIAQKEKELQEAWHPVCEYDFTKDEVLSEGWDCDGNPLYDERGLRFGFFSNLTRMIWKEPIGKGQKKVEIEYECETTPFLEVATSGSRTGDGIRLKISNSIELSEGNGRTYRPIASTSPSANHFHYDKPNRVVIIQRGNRYLVELNGEPVFDHHDVIGDQKFSHQYFGIGRTLSLSPCRIRSVKVYKRIPPDYVKSLVVGKMLLFNGRRDLAERWYSNFVKVSPDSKLVPEALLSLSKCTDSKEREEKVLRRMLVYTKSDYRSYALHSLALLTAKQGNLSEALKYCREATEAAPELGTVGSIIKPLTPHLLALSPEERSPHIRELLKLLQASYDDLDGGVNLGSILKDNMGLLEGTRFRTLVLDRSSVTDISTLEGKFTEGLSIKGTKVRNLAPLKWKALRRLNVSETPLVDISPLRGHLYDMLYLDNCKSLDLSTLAGVRACLLSLNGVPVTDPNVLSSVSPAILRATGCGIENIDFVRGKKYFDLRLNKNQIRDISPLSETEVRWLFIRSNHISDLRPLSTSKVIRLDISNNPVSDIGPLSGLPLTTLSIYGTKIRDLTTLKSLNRLENLNAGHLALDSDALNILRELPVARLKVDNNLQYLFAVSDNMHLKELNGFPAVHARPVLAEMKKSLSTPTASRPATRLMKLGVRCPDGRVILFLPIRMNFPSAQALAQRLGGRLVTDGDNEHMQFLARYIGNIVGSRSRVWIAPGNEPKTTKPSQPYVFPTLDKTNVSNGISRYTLSKGVSAELPVIIEWP